MFPKLLRRREVEKVTLLSRATIYRMMDLDEFPRPIRLGQRMVTWRADDVTAWLEARTRTGDSTAA